MLAAVEQGAVGTREQAFDAVHAGFERGHAGTDGITDGPAVDLHLLGCDGLAQAPGLMEEWLAVGSKIGSPG